MNAETKGFLFAALVMFIIFIIIMLIIISTSEKKEKIKRETEEREYNNGKCTKCGTNLEIIKSEYNLEGQRRRTYLCPNCKRLVIITTGVDLDPETGLYGYVKPENNETKEESILS